LELKIMAVDVATISVGLQSLKAAFEIGKALLNLGLSVQVQDHIREMNDRILSAQESAIASRDYQSALLKQIGNLEKQIADLEAWEAEAQTYELTNIRPKTHPMGGAFAYAPKEEAHPTEPPHFICANCYQDRHKSILQEQFLYPGQCHALICPRCRVIIYKDGHPYPEHFGLRAPKHSNR
jgi:hypothetical protein